MKIAIGSKNPAKIHAVQDTLIREGFNFVSLDVDSKVSDQPFTDEETILGANNRALAALEETGSLLAIGLEGGVVETSGGMILCSWGVLVHSDGRKWIAGGARIPLPEEIRARLLKGEELGPLMAEYTGKKDIRKNQGAIGVFTGGMVSRKEMFSHIVKLLYGQYKGDSLTN